MARRARATASAQRRSSVWRVGLALRLSGRIPQWSPLQVRQHLGKGLGIRAGSPYACENLRGRHASARRCSVSQPEYGQDANPSSTLVDDNERPGRRIGFMLLQSRNDNLLQGISKYVLPTNLKYAGSGRVGERKHRAEVQIMGEHGVSVLGRPLHYCPIVGARISDRGPVDRLPSVVVENGYPIGRQVHVNQKVDAHECASGTSRSSTLHAA